MAHKRAIVSVVNDLSTDQRVDRVCSTLSGMGFRVLLLGRRRRTSIPIGVRSYNTHRMRLLFEKGPVFYAEFNIRLFFFLLFHRCDLLVANDLDTLAPNFLVHQLKRIPVVYDSHEYFTETPEVIHRPFVRKTWLFIERTIFPRLTDIITVSDSIATEFEKRYRKKVSVVRNVPVTRMYTAIRSRKELGLPENRKIVLLQGSGINIQRGAEELVLAAKFLENVLILIIGGGDVTGKLKEMVLAEGLSGKVMILMPVRFDELYQYTANADIGVSVDKDTNLNYRFSLPNKLFDYIHAGIPVLVSPLTEIRKIVEEYRLGVVIGNHDPEHIAEKIKSMLDDPGQMAVWRSNTVKAARELCWEKEKEVLIRIYEKYA